MGHREAVLTLRWGVLYFAIVFGAGFLLGPIRVLWAVPRFGARMAELMEMPIMLVVILLAARWIDRAHTATASQRLRIGGVGLVLMLLAELVLVRPLRGLSIREYLASLDPVSGTAYCLALGALAAMPWLVGAHQSRPSRSVTEEAAGEAPGSLGRAARGDGR